MWSLNSFAPALANQKTKPRYLHLHWDANQPSHQQLADNILPNLADELAQPAAKSPPLYLTPSPLEGLLLKLRLTSTAADDEPLARALLAVGVSRETLHAWADNPLVDAAGGGRVPLFDAFAGLSGGQLLAKAQNLAGDPFEEDAASSGIVPNEALVLVLPQALAGGEAALPRLRTALLERGLAIRDEGELVVEAASARAAFRGWTDAAATAPTAVAPSPEGLVAFAAASGQTWSAAVAAGEVLSATEAHARLGLDADDLALLWGRGTLRVRLGASLYASRLGAPEDEPAVSPLQPAPVDDEGDFDVQHPHQAKRTVQISAAVLGQVIDTLKEVAVDDFRTERYERAVKHLTVALTLDPSSHVLFSNRCTAHTALERLVEALSDADECIRLQPEWPKGFLRRGTVLFRMGKLEEAAAALTSGLEHDAQNEALKKEAEAVARAISEREARMRESLELKERAAEAFGAQDFARAAELLTRAVLLDPHSAVLYSNRAAAHMMLDQHREALSDADEAIRLKPGWAKGHSRRGAALYRLGDLAGARDALEQALALGEGDSVHTRGTRMELQLVADAIESRSRRALELKDRAVDAFGEERYARALELLNSAIELDPSNAALFSNRSAAYAALEQHDAALKSADEAIRLKPDWAKAHGRRAVALLALGDVGEARAACERGLDLEPDSAFVLQEMRHVRVAESLALKDAATRAFKAGEYEATIGHLSAAIDLDDENHVFYSNRSVAHAAMRAYDKALSDADACVRLQPEWTKGYSRRGAALFHLGELQAAKAAYSHAWDLEPTNAKVKADLEHVLSEIAGMRVVLPDRTEADAAA